MPIKLSSLRRLEPAHSPKGVGDDDTVLVLVKLAKGKHAPDYIKVRSEFGPDIVSAEVVGRDLTRLGEDPAVVSVQRSERMPIVR